MIMLILVGILALFLIGILIFSATSYKRMINTYRKYDDEFVYCNLTGYEFLEYAIPVLKLNTKVAFLEKELEDCYGWCLCHWSST